MSNSGQCLSVAIFALWKFNACFFAKQKAIFCLGFSYFYTTTTAHVFASDLITPRRWCIHWRRLRMVCWNYDAYFCFRSIVISIWFSFGSLLMYHYQRQCHLRLNNPLNLRLSHVRRTALSLSYRKATVLLTATSSCAPVSSFEASVCNELHSLFCYEVSYICHWYNCGDWAILPALGAGFCIIWYQQLSLGIVSLSV